MSVAPSMGSRNIVRRSTSGSISRIEVATLVGSKLTLLISSGKAVVHQRFFKVGGLQRYFEVTISSPADDRTANDDLHKGFFRQQEEEIRTVGQDTANASNLVEGFDDHRSAFIPWLKATGIVDHVRGLKKDDIRAAIAFPSGGGGFVLQTVLEATEVMLQEAHKWCFDGPECMLTWPCRVVLSRFQS